MHVEEIWFYVYLLLDESQNSWGRAYPEVKPAPGKLNPFTFYVIEVVPLPSGIRLGWWFTDGLYTIGEEETDWFHYPDWTEKGGVYAFPAGWDVENTTLVIDFFHEPTESGELELHAFIPMAGKIQYLPIMGIG